MWCHAPGQMSPGVAAVILEYIRILYDQLHPVSGLPILTDILQAAGKWSKKALVSYSTNLKTIKNINSDLTKITHYRWK